MPFKDFKVSYLNTAKISDAVEAFRSEYCGASIPVDIETILERELKIDIVPVPDLKKLCNSDAFITSNWKIIYIDKDDYLDERYLNRIRFSLAHEIGHFILHKSIYEKLGIEEIKDFIKFFDEVPQEQHNFFEVEANKFSSLLLIPRDVLARERAKLLEKKDSVLGKLKEAAKLNSYLAIPLSEVFGVSEQATEIALSDIKN